MGLTQYAEEQMERSMREESLRRSNLRQDLKVRVYTGSQYAHLSDREKDNEVDKLYEKLK